jgi:hypothetical protein
MIFRKKSCKKRAYTLIKRLSPQIFTKVVTATLGNLKNHERALSSDERSLLSNEMNTEAGGGLLLCN